MQSGIYRHYKGGYYQVLGVGVHTETNERFVVYLSLDPIRPGPRLRLRPLYGIKGWSTPQMLPGGKGEVTRFEYVGDEIPDA
jgi:hypothetical protein